MKALSLALAVLTLFAAGCGGSDADSNEPSDQAEGELGRTTAAIKKFDCKTERQVDGKDHRIKFAIKNISSARKIEVLTPEGREDPDYMPIKVTPNEGRVPALNENLSAATGSRLMRISGDSDGFFLIDLVLYKNSDYTKGYLKIHGSEDDGPHQYSKVTCEVR
jgi:hypothetical protein